MRRERIVIPPALGIQLNHHVISGRPNLILSSGYGIFGFDEPVQVALRQTLDELEIGWTQYTYPERDPSNELTDLLISSGASALAAVFRWVSSHSPSSVGLFGISFGANISLETALLLGDVSLLMLINPIFDYIDFRGIQLGQEKMDEWRERSVISIDYGDRCVRSYYRFIEEARRQDLISRAQGVKCEVFACQGEEDVILGKRYIERFSALSRNISTSVIPDADHAFASQEAIDGFMELVEPVLQSWAGKGPR